MSEIFFTDYCFHGSFDDVSELMQKIIKQQDSLAKNRNFSIENISAIEPDKAHSYQLNISAITPVYDSETIPTFLKKTGLNGIKFSFCADGPDDILIVYDPNAFGDFSFDYKIDYETDKESDIKYLSESDTISLLQRLLDSTESDLDELIAMACEVDDDTFINITAVQTTNTL